MKFLAAFILGAGLVAGAASALAGPSWNGTWIGNWANNGNGIQIIFADNDVTGMFWNGDYLDNTKSSLSKDSSVVTITWPSASAMLTRDSETAAHIVIHEKGKADSAFAITRDNN